MYDSRSKAGNSWANSNRISKEVLIKGLLTKVWAQLRAGVIMFQYLRTSNSRKPLPLLVLKGQGGKVTKTWREWPYPPKRSYGLWVS